MLVTSQPRRKAHWSPVGRTHVTQSYYVVREASADFATYWSTVRDPDGNIRDRSSDVEKQQYLSDRSEEIAFINSRQPGVVLDYGCGRGWLLEALDWRWSKIGIEVAEDALQELKCSHVDVRGCLWDVADCECDVVMCYHVIEHIVDPVECISHLRRVLKPGGWLVIGTPDFDSPCAKRFGDRFRMLHDPTHCSLFSLESMHRFLRDHSLKIMDVRFPFPERFATVETFARWNDLQGVSPPWPGNWMTFYCQR